MKILLALTKIYGHEPMKTLECWKNPDKALLNETYQFSEKEEEKSELIKAFIGNYLVSLPAGGGVPVRKW